MTTARSLSSRLGSVSILMAAAAICACSKDAAKSDSTAVALAGAVPAPAATKASFDPTTRVAVIHARDFAFDAPDTISAGWTTLHLVNDGPGLHHAALVRIDSGKTAEDFETAMKNPGPPPAWMVEAGGPNAPSPGGQVDAMVNLTAGNYLIVCFVDTPDHVPHFMKGMVRPLTVTPATASAGVEPTADETIDLADYTFTTSTPLTSGQHTIKVVNDGKQHHEVELVRLAPGKTIEDLASWMYKPAGPPPGDALGGIAGVMPGAPAQYFVADLTPGNYAFICLLPDVKDGKPHTAHGMVKEFSIK